VVTGWSLGGHWEVTGATQQPPSNHPATTQQPPSDRPPRMTTQDGHPGWPPSMATSAGRSWVATGRTRLPTAGHWPVNVRSLAGHCVIGSPEHESFLGELASNPWGVGCWLRVCLVGFLRDKGGGVMGGATGDWDVKQGLGEAPCAHMPVQHPPQQHTCAKHLQIQSPCWLFTWLVGWVRVCLFVGWFHWFVGWLHWLALGCRLAREKGGGVLWVRAGFAKGGREVAFGWVGLTACLKCVETPCVAALCVCELIVASVCSESGVCVHNAGVFVESFVVVCVCACSCGACMSGDMALGKPCLRPGWNDLCALFSWDMA